MKTSTSIRYLVILGWTALSLFSLVLLAGATEPTTGGIPDIMAAPPSPASQPIAAGWVQEIQNSVQTYKSSYPSSNFEPYLKKLTLVQEGARHGDRHVVQTEMGAFFKMLARRAHGINEVAAEELTNFAQMVTPMEEYGISVPRSGASQYGEEIVR
jgi:hypothetical protein